MPENPSHPLQGMLCDTCRQNIAVRHFWADEDPPVGRLRHRHLCVSCPYPITDWQLAELTQILLRHGKCEHCGGQPFSFGGIPGRPDRKLLCAKCADLHYGKPPDALEPDAGS